MRILGLMLMFFGIFFAGACGHAIGMFQQTGDPRWFLTIIGAPIMGTIIVSFGYYFTRLD